MTPRRYHKELWKGIVNGAKFVARIFNDPAKRYEGIIKLREIAQTIPAPDRKIIGLKHWWRAILLLHSPKLFIYDTRFAIILNRDRHKRSKQLFG